MTQSSRNEAQATADANVQNNSFYTTPFTAYDFEMWASAVKRQMLKSLQKRYSRS
ncbi:MAG: hypothetical protein WBA57_00060 [Elainellaceae cyanobacterium]